MHQHPRSSVPSPAPNFPPRPTARDDRREQEAAPSSPTVDMGSNSARGLGIEPGPQPSEQGRNAALGREALTRLNQIISNYHTKAALIILHSRVALPPSFNKGSESPRVNRWVCFHLMVGFTMLWGKVKHLKVAGANSICFASVQRGIR